jgi:Tfp pilus assembly protein PilP
MKLTTSILTLAMMAAGGAFSAQVAAQNPDAIDNARSVAKSLQQKQANDSNAALDAAGVGAKPAPGAPAPAVKPAVIPGAKPVAAAPAPAVKPAATAKPAVAKPAPAAKPAVASGDHNQLQRVNVVAGTDTIRVEISSSGAVTPKAIKLDSPARIMVALPGTIDATPKNHIPVGNAGVKGVRIGMDGKTPPTTSVVVDLEKAIAYELTPGPADKLVLTLHVQGAVASNPAPAKTAAPAAAPKTATVAKTAPAPAKAQPAATAAKNNAAPAKAAVPLAQPQTVAKAAATPAKPTGGSPAATGKPATAASTAAKPAPEKQPAAKSTKVVAAAPSLAEAKKPEPAKQQPKPEEKKWAMSGKRDPFFSPVVQASGSGCSTGKKCLEINAINLRGVVKSDSGFIAVVTNNLNKAYFLRENDPVFNGYVLKITGDSVVFQETVEDKLGKPFTREVVKRIYTPAV